MRALNKEELEERKRKVLQYVVHEYVRTGKPVGSGAIATASRLGLSSATIRNVLSELKKEDLISQPHTSAGSTPTDKGYRLFVDSLIELQRLAIQEQVRIQNEYETRVREIEDLMSKTSRMLSSLSQYTGFIMTPKLDRNLFSHLELVPMDERRILVAMITESGLTQHFIANTHMEIPREQLRRVARIINENFQGCTLQDVQTKLVERLENAQQEYREVMGLASEIAQEIKKMSMSEIYLDGASNILGLPDFSKAEEMYNLFKIIEEKQILTNLLESELVLEYGSELEPGKSKSRKEKSLEKGHLPAVSRVHVRIGSENPIKAMQNLSVVSSTYQLSDKTVGVLGILGPKRMEYPKMIALVDYVSQMVNRLVKELGKQ